MFQTFHQKGSTPKQERKTFRNSLERHKTMIQEHSEFKSKRQSGISQSQRHELKTQIKNITANMNGKKRRKKASLDPSVMKPPTPKV